MAEIMAALFFAEMRFDPRDPHNPDADRFVLTPLHARLLAVLLVVLIAAAAAYAVLMRPVHELAISSGGLVLGVWGIRALLTPGTANWAGIACFKRAYPIFRERGYRTRLLAAAYRHHLHWSQLIGGDVVLTIPAKWQRLFNASEIEVRPRMDEPVPAEIVEELRRLVPDFRRAYEPEGLAVEEFDAFGATVRTLRTFIASYHDLAATVRDFMLPNPDVA